MLEEFSSLEKKVQTFSESYRILKEKSDSSLRLIQEKEDELNLFIEEQEALRKENAELKKLLKEAHDRENNIISKLNSVHETLDSLVIAETKLEEPHSKNIAETKLEEPHSKNIAETKLEITPSKEEDLISISDREDPFSSATDTDWDSSIEEKKIETIKEEVVNNVEETTYYSDEYMLDTEDDEFSFGLEDESEKAQ